MNDQQEQQQSIIVDNTNSLKKGATDKNIPTKHMHSAHTYALL